MVERAKREGFDHYMECSVSRCQGLREVLEAAAGAALRHKSLPPHVRMEHGEATRARMGKKIKGFPLWESWKSS